MSKAIEDVSAERHRQRTADAWTAYSGEKCLKYPGKNSGRRLLLLIDAPDVAIYDFVASAHQDGYGRFWLGIPGQWTGPEGNGPGQIGHGWTVKAWMPAPEPMEFARSYNEQGQRPLPATPHIVPDSECKFGKCGYTTTGCIGTCKGDQITGGFATVIVTPNG